MKTIHSDRGTLLERLEAAEATIKKMREKVILIRVANDTPFEESDSIDIYCRELLAIIEESK